MERALSTYEAVGASTGRGRLLSRMRMLGVRRGPRCKHAAATSGWAALTSTERQVADLVHPGLTNPEIAAHLFVSPRTVQSHVSHILAKLHSAPAWRSPLGAPTSLPPEENVGLVADV